MAESKKPASPARKKATKRGPTKAAALKALDLTQEDLNAIKAIQAQNQENHDHPKEPLVPEVDDVEEKAAPEAMEFYARNLRNIEVHFRLSRQSDKAKKRTDLKPRGQRGDMVQLEEGDLQDGELLTQRSFGLIEIIPAGEAKKVMQNQATNQQQQGHSVTSLLRNELGQEYPKGAVKVTESYEDQGVVVARLDPQGGGAGNLPSKGRSVDWAATRSQNQVAAPTGNGIISDGFNPPAGATADAVARRKDLEGPAAGLGNINVVVAPVATTDDA